MKRNGKIVNELKLLKVKRDQKELQKGQFRIEYCLTNTKN
jgi:hypothetical protein